MFVLVVLLIAVYYLLLYVLVVLFVVGRAEESPPAVQQHGIQSSKGLEKVLTRLAWKRYAWQSSSRGPLRGASEQREHTVRQRLNGYLA